MNGGYLRMGWKKEVEYLEKRLAYLRAKRETAEWDRTIGAPKSERRKIYDYLSTTPATTREVAEALDIMYYTAVNRITELQHRKLVHAISKVKTRTGGNRANVWGAIPVNTAEPSADQ